MCVLSSLSTPQGALKEINTLLSDFLLDSKSDKMISDYDKGGLKMIDVQSFLKSISKNEVDTRLFKWWLSGEMELFFDYLEKYGGQTSVFK